MRHAEMYPAAICLLIIAVTVASCHRLPPAQVVHSVRFNGWTNGAGSQAPDCPDPSACRIEAPQ